MCDLRRIAQIIGAIPRETAGSFQEVPLNSRITPWVFNKRSNLTFICVRSLHLLRRVVPPGYSELGVPAGYPCQELRGAQGTILTPG